MTAPQNPRVTQADLDAAQALCASGWTHAIEAFARHREAAEAASKAREAALVEALAIFDEPMSPLTGGERGDELACAVRTFLSSSGDSK